LRDEKKLKIDEIENNFQIEIIYSNKKILTRITRTNFERKTN
jgi:hypothetical protein